jgi:hypothetical protein
MTYPKCRECGADLMEYEERQEGLCQECLEKERENGGQD